MQRVVDDLVLNFAHIVLVIAAFTRSVRWLRYLLIVGSFASVTFGLISGFAAIVFWNLLIGGLHTFRVIRDLRAERAVSLSEDERAIRDLVLRDVSEFDFHMFWAMGRDASYTDESIVAAGSRPDTVGLIVDGVAQVVGTDIDVKLERGQLIGEMSYVWPTRKPR